MESQKGSFICGASKKAGRWLQVLVKHPCFNIKVIARSKPTLCSYSSLSPPLSMLSHYCTPWRQQWPTSSRKGKHAVCYCTISSQPLSKCSLGDAVGLGLGVASMTRSPASSSSTLQSLISDTRGARLHTTPDIQEVPEMSKLSDFMLPAACCPVFIVLNPSLSIG